MSTSSLSSAGFDQSSFEGFVIDPRQIEPATHNNAMNEPVAQSPQSSSIKSLNGNIEVLGFSPSQGPTRTVISAQLPFSNPYPGEASRTITFKIVVGGIIAATVANYRPGGLVELRAAIPAASYHLGCANLSIEASYEHQVFDAVEFGMFTVTSSTESTPVASPQSSPLGKRAHIDDISVNERLSPEATPSVLERTSSQDGSSSSSSDDTYVPPRAKKARLVRTSQIDGESGDPVHDRINLIIEGDLDEMTKNWSNDELVAQRRLVQFFRVQDGSDLRLSFQPVSQEDYVDRTIVVSCIFRPESDDCYITSVDLIYLLESAVGNHFSVEEKNRIRRNLEAFAPLTITKNKVAHAEFFGVIMGFPHPRPRNIEKDVKVFSWKLLKNALEKVINKYSYLPSNGSLVEGRPKARTQKPEPAYYFTRHPQPLSAGGATQNNQEATAAVTSSATTSSSSSSSSSPSSSPLSRTSQWPQDNNTIDLMTFPEVMSEQGLCYPEFGLVGTGAPGATPSPMDENGPSVEAMLMKSSVLGLQTQAPEPSVVQTQSSDNTDALWNFSLSMFGADDSIPVQDPFDFQPNTFLPDQLQAPVPISLVHLDFLSGFLDDSFLAPTDGTAL